MESILAAKAERRKRLANLPIDEKIDLIEKFRDSLPDQEKPTKRAIQ